MSWKHLLMALAVAAFVSLQAASVYAEGDKQKPTAEQRNAAAEEKARKFDEALASANVTLADGIAKAEAHCSGKAIAAMYRMGKGGLVINVSCMTEGKPKRCQVNAETGEVVSQGRAKKPREKKDGEHGKAEKKKKDKKDKDQDDDDGEDGDMGGDEE